MKLDTLATFYVVDSVLDETTGKRYKAIISTQTEMVSTEEVGAETYYNAYTHNVRLTRTIQMRKMSYNGQQYVKVENTVYQVTRVAKGITPQFIKLPLTLCTDKEVVDIIGEHSIN